jgi:P-type Ca2+ transporter type 2C
MIVNLQIMEREHEIGLTDDRVRESRQRHGWNRIDVKRENPITRLVRRTVKEPMLLILIATSLIYFTTSSYAEGFWMLAAVILIFSISLYQETRSHNALEQLKAFSQPKAHVIRNGSKQEIRTEELVVDDIFIVEEGFVVPADAAIVRCNDLSVNEAILTGESLSVFKSPNEEIYQGTLVTSGMAVCRTVQVGAKTKVGEIGQSLQGITEKKSPLEIQISDFVQKMAVAGIAVFAFILVINFLRFVPIRESLLNGLTLAMSILPEEIPVAFATFMALGSWRLMQRGIIVKQTKTVETLGSANVICVDKTGTITKNEMSLASVYVHSEQKIIDPTELGHAAELITTAMWASEQVPFDPMEKSLHGAYEKITKSDMRPAFNMIREYPLSGSPPFMTHVFRDSEGDHIIAAKGAPEAIVDVSSVSPKEKHTILRAFDHMAQQGFRVLGVAEASFTGSLPKDQREFAFRFIGMVAFYDPPKANISEVLQSFYRAGLKVKIITGDNAATTRTIAQQINFRGWQHSVTGDEVMNVSDELLPETVREANIFTRMFPQAKLRVIGTLMKGGDIVAMTGDGVNDAPALKAAHIGIAMGKKGSEVAKQSSSLILMDDDLTKLVTAIGIGRQIYSNLKKAVQYIVSIHIPIILIVFIPLLFGWAYPSIFTPIHIIFLELIMGPTCSIIYENEPMEENVMNEKPREFTKTFFRVHELLTSVVQGLMITFGLITIYHFAISNDATLAQTTTMVFVTLITANILLTLVNRSFLYPITKTIRYKNKLIVLVITITITLVVAILQFPILKSFFRLESMTWNQLVVCVATGIASVAWFELYKMIKLKLSKARAAAQESLDGIQ